MRIFVTGASGFIGSHLLEQLAGTKHQVAALLRPAGDRRRIEPWLGGVEIISGDLSRLEQWAGHLAQFAPETVIHLAWSGVVNSARDNPDQTRNVQDTAELVKVSHRAGAKSWVGLGSQAEYGPCNERVDESQPANPTTLYGVAKLAAGLMARGLCASLKMRFAWLRLFSAYGPRDDASWMIPSLILALKEGRRPALTRCEQLWDYVYAADAAEVVLMTALSSQAEGVFNLGSGQARALREIVETIRDMVRPGAALGFGEVPYRPDQVMHLEANVGRLQALTGWRPKTALAEGLRRTVDFYCGQNVSVQPA
jgi:UDP-glucose 4-epimerase